MVRWTIQMLNFTAQVKSTLQYVMVKTSWQLTIQKVLKYSHTSGQVTLVVNVKIDFMSQLNLMLKWCTLPINKCFDCWYSWWYQELYIWCREAIAADPWKETDSNGVLTRHNGIRVIELFDMSGFVAVWVPVGASDDQDIKCSTFNEAKKEMVFAHDWGLWFHNWSTKDSQTSKLSRMVSDPSVYNNRLLKMSIVQIVGVHHLKWHHNLYLNDRYLPWLSCKNGYACGSLWSCLGKNNKYGSKEDLRDALKALHKRSINSRWLGSRPNLPIAR